MITDCDLLNYNPCESSVERPIDANQIVKEIGDEQIRDQMFNIGIDDEGFLYLGFFEDEVEMLTGSEEN